LLQGFSAGAELGGVVVYLAEISPPNRRAFYTCWQVGSQQFAVMAASLIGLVLLYTLSTEELARLGLAYSAIDWLCRYSVDVLAAF
jgi:MFS family permease